MKLMHVAVLTAAALVLMAACKGSSGESAHTDITPLQSPTPRREATPRPTPSPTPSPVPSPTVPPEEPVSLAWLTADTPVLELPASFAPPVPDPALQVVVEGALAPYEGAYSVVVHHLGDGRYAAVDPDRVYYAASLYKLALLLEVYRQRDAGEIDLGQMLTLEEKYVEYDFGTLELLGLEEGDEISLADAVRAMIVVSDTPTAVMVGDVVGLARADATLRSLGIQHMTVNSYDLPTTARDMARLLEAVAAGEGVSAESRRAMLSLLLQEGIRPGIPAGVPAGTPVAHKTGNWMNATHDVALVWSPAGPYIIAVLSDQPWTWEPVVEVSRAVYGYFTGGPRGGAP